MDATELTCLSDRVVRAVTVGHTDAVELNDLLSTLAHMKETDALIRVWDTRGRQPIYNGTWHAIEQLHDLGKGKIPRGTILLPADRTRLAPARRLHKIVKGRIIHNRSEAAKPHMDSARRYVQDHPEYCKLKRHEQVKFLRTGLGVSNDAARGLVTKLKQKK